MNVSICIYGCVHRNIHINRHLHIYIIHTVCVHIYIRVYVYKCVYSECIYDYKSETVGIFTSFKVNMSQCVYTHKHTQRCICSTLESSAYVPVIVPVNIYRYIYRYVVLHLLGLSEGLCLSAKGPHMLQISSLLPSQVSWPHVKVI